MVVVVLVVVVVLCGWWWLCARWCISSRNRSQARAVAGEKERELEGEIEKEREGVREREWDRREGKKRKDGEASDRDTVFAARRPLPRV